MLKAEETVLTDEQFERLVIEAHGNGGLFEPEQADAFVLLVNTVAYAESDQREEYARAAERLVMPYSHHFGDKLAKRAALDRLKGIKRASVELKPRVRRR